METDGDIMERKGKGNKKRITESKEKERTGARDTRKEMKRKREAIKIERGGGRSGGTRRSASPRERANGKEKEGCSRFPSSRRVRVG